ncbi:TonB-dependent receptor [Sphingobacteruim zhuxiongii]|uniref:TonB-dependent receptor plug domain-containing protein n=1 Tax=Sphingobacterium zhuxiongii TaxID=2662364 RepID=A0A5Q0QAH8_9SPHI|nr:MULTISPECIES: carboxypeptidase-like regulatory domain-containing protein [unclassified Sphingobacterium]QGA26159.1 TonB-dependent receptor plug domain-containing protein [Sphingobacterium sp. dk4302]
MLFFAGIPYSFGQITSLRGRVVNDKNKPLAFATIRINNGEQVTSSNDNGEFSISIFTNQDAVQLSIYHVGKKTLQTRIRRQDFSRFQSFVLEELSLTLQGVNIIPTYQNTKNSNSSIFFDKETIEATQAFSLQDVLKNLPGKANIAPNVNQVETFTLRGGNTSGSGADNVFNLNNSLGIAIIMDDMYLSNDANMQSRSASRWGMTSATLSGVGFNDSYLGMQSSKNYDVAFQGIDLREIPVNNIESIEVIQGVASAKYGEITDGAIIINRQAGSSPWAVNLQLNGGSVSTGISKGFELGKIGALNVSTNYTNSNADPRDKIKTFNRINQSLMWTKRFRNDIKNTLSFDYNYRNDHRRLDPDDDQKESSKFTNKGFSISNRLAIPTNIKWLNTANFNVNFSRSKQNSYKQYILNRGITAITIKDTTGIYKGYFSNGSYRAEEEIVGIPINFGARLDASSQFEWGSSKHQLSYGINYSLSNNGGQGIISDPDRPRWLLNGGGNERAYDFEHLPNAQNWGLFIENSIRGTIGTRAYQANLGLRADIQNGFLTLQPRVNTSFKWNDQWSSTASFGISSKAPTLAHMYPAPVFIDIELLKIYAGDLSKALYLVYTDKKILDNAHLKPSMSSQLELGMQYKGSILNSALYTYFKQNWNGFETVNSDHHYTLPNYNYEVDPISGEISYSEAGTTSNYFGFYGYEMTNGAKSETIGLDWMINFNQIKAIKTSFSILNNVYYSAYKRTQPLRIQIENNKIILPDQTSMTYAVYDPNEGNQLQIMSKLNSSTHIPKVGFIVNFSADVFWRDRLRSSNSILPVAYYNSNGLYKTVAEAPLSTEVMNGLKRISEDMVSEDLPFVYCIVNMSLVKEINKKFRINLNAYNLFNIRPEHYSVTSSGIERIYKYNRRPSFTIGTNIKF